MLPSEILEKEFTKGVRGYKEDEVDSFLEQIAIAYSDALASIDSLKLQLEERDRKIAEYKAQESAMAGTLEAARALMSDISASAEKRADIMIKNAELDAELKKKQAEDAVNRLKDEEDSLRSIVTSAKLRFRNLLEAELARFDSLSEGIFDVPSSAASEAMGAGSASSLSSDSFFKDLDKLTASARGEDEDLSITLTNIRRTE